MPANSRPERGALGHVDERFLDGQACYPVDVNGPVSFSDPRSGEQRVLESVTRHEFRIEASPCFEARSGNWLAERIPALPDFDQVADPAAVERIVPGVTRR